MESYTNSGFELINGNAVFEGEILGGCLETIFDMFDNSRFEDTVRLCEKYELFPKLEEWRNKILLLETSEEMSSPDLYRKMIRKLQNFGIFEVIAGLLIGKPLNEIYVKEYKTILLEEITNKQLPIVCNVNVGHATPRCIIPFGVHARVDVNRQIIEFIYA